MTLKMNRRHLASTILVVVIAFGCATQPLSVHAANNQTTSTTITNPAADGLDFLNQIWKSIVGLFGSPQASAPADGGCGRIICGGSNGGDPK